MDSLLINPVLAYVKAFWLRGDLDSLKHVALGKFALGVLAEAKKNPVGQMFIVFTWSSPY